MNIFETCKKPLLEQNFSLISQFWAIFSWLKFCPNHWVIFSRKNFAQRHKKSPKWQNFAQSGHPGLCLHPLYGAVVEYRQRQWRVPGCRLQ